MPRQRQHHITQGCVRQLRNKKSLDYASDRDRQAQIPAANQMIAPRAVHPAYLTAVRTNPTKTPRISTRDAVNSIAVS